MKKQLLISAILLGSAAAAQAQSNVIKLNTVSLALQTGSFFFEHQVNSDHSLNLGLFVTNYSSSSGGTFSHKTQWTGFGLTGEYRIYTGGEALHGFFIGPYLRFQNYNYTETSSFLGGAPVDDKATLTTFGGGGVLGWQCLIRNRVSIEPFLGLGYAAGDVDNLEDNHGTLTVQNGIRGVEVRLGLNVGIAFGKDKE
ncbi:outer membrane autotransporter protein [Hymenobacter sp. UYAg731]